MKIKTPLHQSEGLLKTRVGCREESIQRCSGLCKRTAALTLLFTLFILQVYSQWGSGFINFDDTAALYRIDIDNSIPGNRWQIGAPHKSFFTEAYSKPHAMVTDTVNSYPAGKTSVFYYRTSGDFNADSHDAVIDFWYKMDCDSVNDFGKVEISIDSGLTWVNALSRNYCYWTVFDSLHNFIQGTGSSDTLVFTGRSNGWYEFVSDLSLDMGILDSIIYKFTFHSAAESTPRDGWMIDDIQFNTWWESVPRVKKACTVYPNPVREKILLRYEKPVAEFEIVNSMGISVARYVMPAQHSFLDVSALSPGLYLYQIRFDDGTTQQGKFIKTAY
jgi:hypothetical protein